MPKRKYELYGAVNRVIAFILLAALMPYQWASADSRISAAVSMDIPNIAVEERSGSILLPYADYLEKYKESGAPDTSILLDMELNPTVSEGEPNVLENYEGRSGPSVSLTEKEDITWRFKVEQEGFYLLKFDYYPAPGTGGAIERRLLLDGAVPFQEADVLSLDRIWKNQEGSIQYDIQGNQIMIPQVEAPAWREQYAEDPAGFAGAPLRFYLPAGEHTLTLAGIHEPLILRSLSFCPLSESDSEPYSQISSAYDRHGFKRVSSETVITLQGENADAKSSQTLAPLSDMTSPTVTPYDCAKIRYNMIGGSRWTNVGQWIEWRFYAPESGKYALSAHFKQSSKTDSASVREIRIDGGIPFEEAKNWMFPYDSSWQSAFFSDKEGTPYEFYLEKGWHTISLRVALGQYNDILSEAKELLTQLNEIYREIIVITGVSPDTLRDYRLDKMIPDTLKKMSGLSSQLKEFETELQKKDASATNIPEIKKIYDFLDRMTKDSETVSTLLVSYKDSLAAFGTWINSRLGNPLELDWLRLSSAETALPRGEAGFFQRLVHYVRQFVASFFMDYSTIGETGEKAEKSIVVWLTTGRDQAQLLRQCALSTFTPKTGITTDVQLVSPDALLPAILAKKGPDVVLGVAQDMPVNLALRNALLDLTGFEDIEVIKEWFYPSALMPFQFNAGLYALPETQTFPMLFYRKDILNQMGISLSELDRWDTLLGSVQPKLQKNSLSFGMAHSFTNYLAINYQHSGALYDEENRVSRLSDSCAIDSMEWYSKLYTQYKLPVVFDFANRFRTGEIPVAVADYTQYNTLVMFAPEIKGLWGMLPIPGTLQEDGTVNRAAANSVTGAAILATSNAPQEAWQFLSWWVSQETQTQFGHGLESIIGAAARYNTANRASMKDIQWDAEMKHSIIQQAEQLQGIPEIPGGYITTRLFDFAFRKIVYDGENVRKTLEDTVFDIDHELANKRKEYDLD